MEICELIKIPINSNSIHQNTKFNPPPEELISIYHKQEKAAYGMDPKAQRLEFLISNDWWSTPYLRIEVYYWSPKLINKSSI